MKKLTQKQLQLLHAIEQLTNENGVSPTIAELKHKLGLKSDQSVYQLLDKLEQAGLIERALGKRRSIRLITQKPYSTSNASSPTYSSSPNTDINFNMDEVQKIIFDKLYEIDPNVANIYKGALFTMAQKSSHPDWIAQAANSFRGIFNTLIRTVEQKIPDGTPEVGVQKISKVFDPHGVIANTEKAAWTHWNQLNKYFTKLSHYDPEYEAKEQEFVKKVDEFNELLRKYVLPDQFDVYGELDIILKNGSAKANSDEIGKYLSTNTAAYTYFFRNADSKWFDFLKSNKFLNPSHQVGEYLARISPSIPSEIVDFAQKYGDDYELNVENKFIRRYFLSAAIQLPTEHSDKIVRTLIKQKWVEDTAHGRDFIFFAGKSLLEKYIKAGEYKSALLLVKPLLGVRLLPEKGNNFRDIEGYVDNYFYGEIIKLLHLIPVSERLDFIKLLISILVEVVNLPGEGKDRYFYIWRPSIGDNERDRHNVIDVVIDAVRDLVVDHLTALSSTEDTSQVIDDLFAGSESNIFRRIKLYLYRQFPEKCLNKIQWSIIEYFDHHEVEREYEDLVRQEFCNIDETFQNKYFEKVKKGSIKENPDNDELYKRYWKIRKLYLVRNCLNEEWKTVYQELLGDDEESKFEPTYSGQITSWTGPTAPKNAVELDSLSVSELVKYLAEWKPGKGFGEPSRMGLGREMAEAVKGNGSKYSKDAMLFNDDGLHPTYLYQYFYGLKEAVRAGQQIDWDTAVDLMTAIVSKAKKDQLKTFEPEEDDWGVDWSSAFQYMADLIENGLNSTTSGIPFTLRSKIWDIITYLCEDKDPDVEYEKKYGGDNSDFYTLSINTTRGQAFHALINYIFWCDKNSKSKSTSRIPDEAKAVLEAHLEIESEPGMTIRSVYGRFFPWLYIYDTDWTKGIIQKLFPLDDLPRRYGAWEVYLINAVYPEIFPDLRPQYEQAILELKKPSLVKKNNQIDPHERLIDHLMIAYAYSVIEYDDPLLKSFYREANKEQRGVGVNFMGRVYIASPNATRDHDPEKDRLKSFWEFRLRDSDSVEELMEFGWWISDGYFDNQWMLEKLLETLSKTNGIIEPSYRVLETLNKLALSYPLLIAKCLLKIVRSKRQDHFMHMAKEEDVKSIVEKLYNSQDEGVQKIISQVSDQMLRLGNDSFRIYIKPNNNPVDPSDEYKTP